jgi:hypothetical protein
MIPSINFKITTSKHLVIETDFKPIDVAITDTNLRDLYIMLKQNELIPGPLNEPKFKTQVEWEQYTRPRQEVMDSAEKKWRKNKNYKMTAEEQRACNCIYVTTTINGHLYLERVAEDILAFQIDGQKSERANVYSSDFEHSITFVQLCNLLCNEIKVSLNDSSIDETNKFE